MKEHILLEKAYRYPEPLNVADPKDCYFDEKRGFWINSKTYEVMMTMDNHPNIQSKKCDIETGEDQKGE